MPLIQSQWKFHWVQRVSKMKETFKGLEGCQAIMDDTLVFGRTEGEHDQWLHAVLERTEKSGLKLNREKCHFKKEKVKFFGHVVSAEGICPDPDKVKAISVMPVLTSLTELRTLCGMINFLSKFVPGLATDMKPLTDLMKKSAVWLWGAAQQKAFETIKEKLSTSPPLGFYRPDRKTVVIADSSSYGLGATVMQWEGDKLIPIAYASRTLTDSERRYAQIEKECLATVWACEKFAKYLLGLDSFELQTDHKPLVPLIRTKDINKTLVQCQRLLIRLMRFNAQVVHVPGKEIVIAGALSRNPVPYTDTDTPEAVAAYVEGVELHWPIAPSRLEKLCSTTVHDPELQQVIGYVRNSWPSKTSASLQAYQQAQGELLLINGLLVYKNRIVVPRSERRDILQKVHETHQGLHKCRQNAQTAVWWPGLS